MNFLDSLSSKLGLDSIGTQISSNIASCFRLHSGACDVLIVRRSDGSLHSTSLLVHPSQPNPLVTTPNSQTLNHKTPNPKP